MLLYIVRHAWAEDRDDSRWPGDTERPLTNDGRKRFGKMVKCLAGADFSPAAIATSLLIRCRQTAELIAEKTPGHPQITPLEALAPGSHLAALVAWTADQGGIDVAWVGHAPDVDRLAAALLDTCEHSLRFAKGAVAAIEFDGPVEAGAGQLRWFATAKLLGV